MTTPMAIVIVVAVLFLAGRGDTVECPPKPCAQSSVIGGKCYYTDGCEAPNVCSSANTCVPYVENENAPTMHSDNDDLKVRVAAGKEISFEIDGAKPFLVSAFHSTIQAAADAYKASLEAETARATSADDVITAAHAQLSTTVQVQYRYKLWCSHSVLDVQLS